MKNNNYLFFKSNCLRSWLEQDTSCPKCRKSLQDDKENQTQQALNTQRAGNAATTDGTGVVAPGGVANAQQQQQQQPLLPGQQGQGQGQPVQRIVHRNLFQFNGSRYISWLPSFSLQVTNGTNVVLPGLLRSRSNLDPDRLADMVCFYFILFSLKKIS